MAVNKMDLVDYAKSLFQRITAEYGTFLQKLGMNAHLCRSRRGTTSVFQFADRQRWTGLTGQVCLKLSARYRLKFVTQNVECQVAAIGNVLDAATLNTVSTDRAELRANEVGDITLQTRAPLVLDNHERVPALGRFVLADANSLRDRLGRFC